MKTAIFDIETDGLLLDLNTIWCAVVYDVDTAQYIKFTPNNIKDLPKCLLQYDTLIGHNILGFDLFAIKKVYPDFSWEGKTIIDTLILSKLAYYDKDNNFSHSLKAWGERLGNYKEHHEEWGKYSIEMLDYCTQDVNVTKDLYQHLKKFDWILQETLDVEQKVQEIITQQYINGWTFDVKKAQELHIELIKEYEEALNTLRSIFKPMFLPVGKVRTYKKIPTIKDGIEYYTNQPIVLTEFNPSSGQHIVWWVEKLYGKQEWKLTDKKNPKTDATTLSEMFSDKEWAKPLIHFFNIKKLLGMLVEGDNAWLRLVRNGKIHHQVDILGTNTGRATHNTPNLAQVPSARAYKGKEVRSLFTVPNNKVQVGCDLSGIELRCLAHYMNDPNYTKQILEGDIHTVNQQAAGLPTRDAAKTFIYAFLYGAGDAKIGTIIGKGAKEGAQLKAKFLKGLPALSKLMNRIKQASKKKYLIGITKRRLHIRSEHSALNVLLQSLGAYISKVWMIEAHRLFKEHNLQVNQLGWIHDEIQVECNKGDEELVAKLLVQAANNTQSILGLRCRIDAEAKIGRNWYEVH